MRFGRSSREVLRGLITTVGTALCFGGCGGDGDALIPSADALVGTYDVRFVDDDGHETATVGRIATDENGMLSVLLFVPTDASDPIGSATLPLTGRLAPDGRLPVSGTGFVSDIVFLVDTELAVQQRDGVQRIGGTIQFANALLALSMVRPTHGVRSDFGGRYELGFPRSPGGNGQPSMTRILLDVALDGGCVASDAPELSATGEVLAQLDAGLCLVSSSGGFRLGIGYIDGTGLACAPSSVFGPPDPDRACPLTLAGTIHVRGGAIDADGRFVMIENGGFLSPVRGGEWHGRQVAPGR